MGYRIAAMQRLLKPEEVAVLLGVSPATLAYWRSAKGEVMPLNLTLLPIRWTWYGGATGAPIAYSVEGLPANENAVIAMRPGGWRLVRGTLSEFDQGRLYSSAEEAAAALKAWIEGGEQTTKAGN
jgi:hypothetical protein